MTVVPQLEQKFMVHFTKLAVIIERKPLERFAAPSDDGPLANRRLSWSSGDEFSQD